METINGKALILSRVSTFQQDLERQTTELRQIAHLKGYDDNHIIILEDKESAIKLSETERNGLNEMKAHIESDNVEIVLVWEITRISRQLPMLYSIRDYLQEHKVQLYGKEPEFTMFTSDWQISDVSNMVFAMYAVIAENEMRIKKARFASGRAKSKAAGRIYCGKPRYGYVLDKKTGCAVPKYEETEIIRDIYYKYANNIMTSAEIANYHYEQGTFGKVSLYAVKRKITHILQLPEYKGIKKQYPAIVSEEIWDKSQERRNNNKWRFDDRQRGEIKIGQRMFYDYNSKLMFVPHGKNYTANMKNGKCNNIGKETAHWCLIELVKYYIKDYINDTHSKLLKQEEHLDKVTNNFMDKIADEKEKLERLDDLYIDGKLTKSVYNSKYTKVETTIKHLEHQMHETLLQRTANLNMRINNQNEDIEMMNAEQQRELIRNIINKIYIERTGFYSLILHVELKTGITEKWSINTNNMTRSLTKNA